MNQYRCDTCKWQDKFLKENELGIDHPYLCTKDSKTKTTLSGCRTVTNETREYLAIVGCASHSDFQSERDKVLDELTEWMKGRYDLPSLKEKIAELRQKAGERG